MPLQEPSTAEITQRVAWMEFQARKSEGVQPESAAKIRRGLDAILTDHPGVIWQASILVARFGESPEEAMQRRYDAVGCESCHGLVVCLDCLDDGCAYVDDDEEPICSCLAAERNAA